MQTVNVKKNITREEFYKDSSDLFSEHELLLLAEFFPASISCHQWGILEFHYSISMNREYLMSSPPSSKQEAPNSARDQSQLLS